MTTHLLVVGERPSGPDEDIDGVAAQVTVRSGSPFVMKRCKSPSALVKVVRDVAIERGALIDTLDLYDHASPGHISMGGVVLFDITGRGLIIARALRPLLTPDARVRLLGCETAKGREGQKLLKMLREELGGGLVVYGTLATITPDLFEGGVFQRDQEWSFLFSSTEASTRVAPSFKDRLQERNHWLSSHRP